MKKTVSALALFLLFTYPVLSQYVNIPDSNFLKALIDEGVDINDDGQIDSLEASTRTNLNLTKKDITDLSGIETFINLDSLNCSSNNLASIDISRNKNLRLLNLMDNNLDTVDVTNNSLLEEMWCPFNKLTSLDVSQNLQLKILYCSFNELSRISTINNSELTRLGIEYNPLQDFDISKNLALVYLNCGAARLTSLEIEEHIDLEILYCNGNSLSELDITNNQNLRYLQCNSNNLSNLDLSDNPGMEYLDCSRNKISALNISQNKILDELMCSDNQLKALETSQNPELTTLLCNNNLIEKLDLTKNSKLQVLNCEDNQLTELYVFNNTSLKVLSCGSNYISRLDLSRNALIGTIPTMPFLDISDLPMLSEVCVWEMPFPPEGLDLYSSGSPNILFTMDCTPVLYASDTVYQQDSVQILCSMGGMVYLVPENTDKDLMEIVTYKIDSLEVQADNIASFGLNGLAIGTYWLYAISDTDKISYPETVTIIGVGLNTEKSHEILIYPNPANEIFTLETDVPHTYTVSITSPNGRIFYSAQHENETCQIDLSGFQKGMYFITIKSKDLVTTRKIIKI